LKEVFFVKKLAKRALSGLLAVVMCFSLLAFGASAETQTVFTDVPSGKWYAEKVAYVYENGLMNGTSATAFAPSASLTRAMFVTILGRLDGVDTSAYGSTSFTDVATGQWYSAYVAWASANGIVNGYSATKFGTNDSVTREQMATIIARYVDYAGVTLPQADSVVASFQDASSVSSWATDGLELMRTTGIITGYTDGTFGPKKTATRAEAATIFMRLDQAIDRVEAQTPIESETPSESPETKPSESPTPSEPETPTESPDTDQNTPEPTIVDSGICGDNLTWTLDENGTLTISGTGDMTDYAKKSAPWSSTKVKSVVINDGVTSIGDYAFYICSKFTSITIPGSVTSIGNGAFQGCDGLTSVTLSEGVTSIGDYAFEGCENLTSITIPDGVTSIEPGTFSGCTSLTSVTIPDRVTSIGDYAFWRCVSLTSITIPDGVISIGRSAFSACSSLTSITIPDGVTSIEPSTFSGCTSLTSVTIPDRVTSIGDYAFDNCESLQSVIIPSGVTNIGVGAFEFCKKLTDITIPDGINAIGRFTFMECISLKSITIPSSVTYVGLDAFRNCVSLTDVYYGGSADEWNSFFETLFTSATIHYNSAQ
jgi:hypothetical protein